MTDKNIETPIKVDETFVEEQKETLSSRPRSPVIAGILAFFCSGLGHIYCGRFWTGVALFAVPPVLLVGILSVTAMAEVSLVPTVMILLVANISFNLAQVIWAVVLTARTPKEYKLKRSNRAFVYIAFLLIGFVAPEQLVVRQYIVEAFNLPSVTMAPTLLVGDHVFVNKLKTPAIGDIVTYRRPDVAFDYLGLDLGQEDLRSQVFVSRIIAMEGQTVELRDDLLLVNGREISREPCGFVDIEMFSHSGGFELVSTPVIKEQIGAKRYVIADGEDILSNFGPKLVPEGNFFVLGDNRDNSNDSRYWGTAPIGNILGVVDSIWWSSGSDGLRTDRIGLCPE